MITIETSSHKLNLQPHEETFEINPIGIKYKCEFCNEGEMLVAVDYKEDVPVNMYPHKCTKCGKVMFLPRMYPYIKWV